MLWKASTLHGYVIAASDGDIGSVSDFLFDDASWRVRWLVVDTGHWLPGRKVLLPPSVLGHPDELERRFAVRSTKKQIGESPTTDADQPVSRQLETSIYDYYGWTPYWGTGFYMGGYGYAPPSIAALSSGQLRKQADHFADSGKGGGDPHLRSVEAVTGYHIHARDGEIGHVEDFLVADDDWSIHYLIVGTRNWWPGRKVLISPRSARKIDWMDRLVHLDVDRTTVESSPAYDASTEIDRAYERKFQDHYAPNPAG
jgi:sporulation protein YlmC with PRC-barrel domain